MNSLVSFFSTYLFLLSALYFLLWWFVLFVSFRKDKKVQKKNSIASVNFMIVTPFIEHLNLTDWWQPTFIWNTFFHIEDLIFGFAITGTTLGIYFWVSKSIRQRIEQQANFSHSYRKVLLIIAVLLTFMPFYFFHIPSFYTEVLCMVFLCVCVFERIPAMIFPAIVTGILLTIIILPGYFLGSYLHPGWIQEYWRLTGWPAYLFLTVPAGEYVYYLFSGLFIPAFAEVFFMK